MSTSTNDMRQKYYELYEYMATSQEPDNMKAFGHVMNEMMEWMMVNKPEAAQNWIEKLESIKWKNYLTQKEADNIVAGMSPKAPWTKEQWKNAMELQDYPMERQPCYNSCALYVEMNKLMSGSSNTISKYLADEIVFSFVHDMAVDALTDADGNYRIRSYFNL